MNSVSEYKAFQPENVIGYVRALPPPLAHIGADILPLRTVDSMKAVWDIVDVKVTAGYHLALDTEIPIDTPPSIKEISQALAKIGKKRVVSEEEKVKLFRPRPGTTETATAEEYVYNILRLISQGVDDRIEAMRWQALSTGVYTYNKYGIKLSVDWGLPGANKPAALAGANMWSDVDNSDPLQDICDWNEVLIDAVGAGAEVAFLSSKVFNYLLQNAKIRNLLSYSQTGRGGAFPTKGQIPTLMLHGEGLRLVEYNAKYNEQDEAHAITATRFLNEERFVMLAPTSGMSPFGLGDVADGPVPDNGMSPGKYADFWTQKEPYMEIARCIQFAFPRIYVPGAIFTRLVHQ